MTTKTRLAPVIILLAVPGLAAHGSRAQDQAPPKLQADIFMKLLAFHTDLGDGPFTIAIVGSPEMAEEFRARIGGKAGKATLADVVELEEVPDSAPAGIRVLYVGEDVAKAVKLTRAGKILSITGIPRYVMEGVTLGIGLENKKPKILLNLKSTKAEDINWNPQILKVASSID